MSEIWPVKLFKKSVLKQIKYKKMIDALGPTQGKKILEIGSDNGVFSYLFRQRGGEWKSADMDLRSVNAIKELVKSEVYTINDGAPLPFADNEFDIVLIVDIIEHLHHDDLFLQEVYRVLQPAGRLIINAPNVKDKSLLMRMRHMVGMTDSNHGHVRPGYTRGDIDRLTQGMFELKTYETHTKFFAKLMDTIMVVAISALKGSKTEKTSGRGVLVTGKDMKSYQKMFRLYSIVYPFVWFISGLDRLLFFRSGYMLIASGYSLKTNGKEISKDQLHQENAISTSKITGVS